MTRPAVRTWSRLVLLAVALALLQGASASASVADEQRQGAALERALTAGERDYDSLSSGQFELLGEYWMGGMLGSARAHAAMNARMRQMMGAQGEERMHQLMGRRFASLCASRAANDSSAGGYGCRWDGEHGGSMMGAYGASGDYDWRPMMGMMMGNWRQMEREDWQGMMDRYGQTAGPTSGGGDGDWETRDVVLLALVSAFGALLATSLAHWQPWRRSRTD